MIDDDPRIDPADLRGAKFPGSFRRYDAKAVDDFLESVAERVEETNALLDRLQAEVESKPAQPPVEQPEPSSPFDAPDLSTISDEELIRLVGEETANVLSIARKAATDIRTKAEESAARVIREATAEAAQTVADAEAKAMALTTEAAAARDTALTAAEESAEKVRATATADAEAVLAVARAEADTLDATVAEAKAAADAEAAEVIDAAKAEGRTMITEAKEVRTRVLADLQRRRDLARTQIERLTAGRDQLLDAYAGIRANVDEITAHLELGLLEPADQDDYLDEGFVGIVDTGADRAGDDTDTDTDTDIDSDIDTDDDIEIAADEIAEASDREPETSVAVDEPSGIDESSEIEDRADHEESIADADADADPDEPVEEPVADVEPSGSGQESTETEQPEPEPEPEPETEQLQPEPEPAAAEPDDTAPDATEPASAEIDETGPAETAPSPTATDDAVAGNTSVDDLFARIRSERAESVARAQQVLAGDAPEPAVAAPPAVHDREPEPEIQPVAEPEAEPEAASVASGSVDTDTDGDGDGFDRVPAELLADADTLTQRAELLDPLDKQLARALKRHLADEQNEVLDVLRRTESTDPADLLPAADDHIAGYAAVAAVHLGAAAEAGASRSGSQVAVDVSTIASELGASLVEAFRRRVERSADEVDGDPDALDERLRALYREWKVEHIGPASSDALLSAFAHGQYDATPAGATLRWLIDPAQGPCPDAQDNALAGPVPKGEAFPTGDVCPQAHPGCRCLLVAHA